MCTCGTLPQATTCNVYQLLNPRTILLCVCKVALDNLLGRHCRVSDSQSQSSLESATYQFKANGLPNCYGYAGPRIVPMLIFFSNTAQYAQIPRRNQSRPPAGGQGLRRVSSSLSLTQHRTKVVLVFGYICTQSFWAQVYVYCPLRWGVSGQIICATALRSL